MIPAFSSLITTQQTGLREKGKKAADYYIVHDAMQCTLSLQVHIHFSLRKNVSSLRSMAFHFPKGISHHIFITIIGGHSESLGRNWLIIQAEVLSNVGLYTVHMFGQILPTHKKVELWNQRLQVQPSYSYVIQVPSALHRILSPPRLISHFSLSSSFTYNLSFADVRGVRLEQEAGRPAVAPKGRQGRGRQQHEWPRRRSNGDHRRSAK